MNIATISGWFQTIAEMIEFSARQIGGWDEFEKHTSKEAPEISKFLSTARAQSSKSRDPIAIQKEPTRAVTKLLRPSMKHKIQLPPDVMRLALEHEPAPENLDTWINMLQNLIDLKAGDPRQVQAIRDRIAQLQGPPREEESLTENLTRLPHFNRKIVLFLGDGSTLVIAKGGGRYFTYGVVRDTAPDLGELDLMLRDIIADRGGIRRTWVDPQN
jgi:hypothetical protein